MNNKSHPIYLTILAFIAIYLVWGSTYLFVAFAVEEVPPFFMAGIRFLIAAVLIFLFSPFYMDWSSVTKEQVKNAAIAGFWFLVLGNGAMTWALKYIDSGFSSLIVSAQPIVILIMMWFFDRTPISKYSMLGVALGMIGMYLLVSQRELVSSPDQWKGLMVIVSCLITWGYGSIFVSKATLPKSHFFNAGIQMAVGAIVLIAASYMFGEERISLAEISVFSWSCIIYLSIFGSIIAFTAFNFLLSYVSPEKVSTSTYVNPIVALFLGWYFRDEIISGQSIIAAIILLTGVYFINTRKYDSNQKAN